MYIQTVGLKDLKTPIRVKEKGGGLQNTIATISMQANLSEQTTYNCADIFTSILQENLNELSVTSFSSILPKLQSELHAKSVRLEMSFPYFIDKKAPVSDTHSLMEYDCTFSGGIGEDEGFILSIRVPVTTLCPCSKEISEYGAHNQRGQVLVRARFKKFIWIEDIVNIVEKSASCELFSVLKREDEKYVTENAYDNPMFVEDLVREVASELIADNNITWFAVSAENFESIHNHSAYAYIKKGDI